ncbi:hypothetical protein ACWF0M_12570 [Kribbella sp. NPDC055110]
MGLESGQGRFPVACVGAVVQVGNDPQSGRSTTPTSSRRTRTSPGRHLSTTLDADAEPFLPVYHVASKNGWRGNGRNVAASRQRLDQRRPGMRVQ